MFKSRGDIVYKCTVRLLEDPEILECEFHPSYKGKYLLEYVCQQLNLTETDYFGLRYVDGNGQRHWLHLAKLILKQVKDASPILFSFRVKFYPPNPLLLKEDATRFQIYLQLKRDLAHGRLFCTPNEAAMLGALTIQIELGDYDPSIHLGNYVTEMRLLVRQTDTIEARIQELHREPVEGTPGGSGGVKGMSTQEAERTFLKIGCQLDTYGVDPHPVKDHRGNQLYLGINHSGILTFQGVRKTNHFKWNEVHKINFEGRMFIVHLNYPEKKHTVGFKCPNGAACRHVWCCAIEQMLFFTLPSSSDACVYTGGGLFSWGTKFKYFGRTEREILERDGLLAPRDAPGSAGGKRKASSVPATPSTPMTGDFGYSSLPRSTHSAPLDDGGMSGECNGGCLLSGPAVDIALACCDPLRALPEEPKRMDVDSMDRVDSATRVDSSVNSSDSSVTHVDSSETHVDGMVTHVDDSDSKVTHVNDSDKIATNLDGKETHVNDSNIATHVNNSGNIATNLDGRETRIDDKVTHVNCSGIIATNLDGRATHLDDKLTRVNGSGTHVDDTIDKVDRNINVDTSVDHVNRTATHVDGTVTDVDAMASKTHLDTLATACAVPEYSLRDSFEHSSSESGVTSHTHGAEEWRSPPPALQPPPRPFSLLRAFVPSFIFVWVSLALLSVLVFETDWVIFQTLKRKPEIISLRRHYYVPLKEYLKRKVVELF